jgi:aspartate oxidase
MIARETAPLYGRSSNWNVVTGSAFGAASQGAVRLRNREAVCCHPSGNGQSVAQERITLVPQAIELHADSCFTVRIGRE